MKKVKRKKLFSKLDIILLMHISITITLTFDFSTQEYWNKAIENFFTYDHGVLISSLLVVWAFLTAIIIYYMERKDERVCGVNNWKIVIRSLKKYQQNSLIVIFALDLLLILFAAIINIPITLVALTILLPILTFYVLFAAIIISDKEEILRLLINIIVEECEVEKGEKTEGYAGNGILDELINGVDMENEEQVDVVYEILTELFMCILNKDCWYENIITILEKVTNKIKNKTLHDNFLKSLIVWGEKEVDYNCGMEIMTAVLATVLKTESKNYVSTFIDVISCVESEEIRNILVLRCVIHNLYQDAAEGKRRRDLVNRGIKKVFTDRGNSNEISIFLANMKEKHSQVKISNKDIIKAVKIDDGGKYETRC